MKNVLVVISILALICGLNSCNTLDEALNYPEPAFDNPNAYVIDSTLAKGSMEDFVRLNNKSRDSNIDFKVYMHRPSTQQWMLYGTSSLKGPGDSDQVDTDFKRGGIEDYRYFAIEPLNGKQYKYEFFKLFKDLVINVLDYLDDSDDLDKP